MEKPVKKEVGLWIDHRKAVIVTIKNEVVVTQEIRSNMEGHASSSSALPSKYNSADQGSTPEDMRERKFENHLGRYYEGIISFIGDADSIWIFGPGEAKGELEKSLRQEGLGDRIVGVATVGKMTNPQIEAKVRSRYYKF
jgi:hypothetical protein